MYSERRSLNRSRPVPMRGIAVSESLIGERNSAAERHQMCHFRDADEYPNASLALTGEIDEQLRNAPVLHIVVVHGFPDRIQLVRLRLLGDIGILPRAILGRCDLCIPVDRVLSQFRCGRSRNKSQVNLVDETPIRNFEISWSSKKSKLERPGVSPASFLELWFVIRLTCLPIYYPL
jgi:hypothetical protein